MNFKNVSTITAVLGLILGAGYLFFGSTMAGRWSIEPTEDVILFCRRIGAQFLGFSLMFFLARNTPASRTRFALETGAALTLSLLAVLGIHSYATGLAGSGILISIVLETLLAIGFFTVMLKERKALTDRPDKKLKKTLQSN